MHSNGSGKVKDCCLRDSRAGPAKNGESDITAGINHSDDDVVVRDTNMPAKVTGRVEKKTLAESTRHAVKLHQKVRNIDAVFTAAITSSRRWKATRTEMKMRMWIRSNWEHPLPPSEPGGDDDRDFRR